MRILAIVALALLPSCSWISAILGGGFERPDLRFAGVRPSGWSLTGVRLELVWQVENPNAQELQVASLAYQLDVEGKRVFAGEPEASIRLPGNETTEVALPATVRFADVLPVAEAILGKDELAYEVRGQVGIDTPIGVLDYPLSAEGSVDVPDPERIVRGTAR